jgi:hypothetical protein
VRPDHDPSRVAHPSEREARHRSLDELRELAHAATAGPWRWAGDEAYGHVRLASCIRMGPSVMEFRRRGMGGAEPVFWRRTDPEHPWWGEYAPARDVALFEVSYRNDVVAIDNPDARWLAAADPTTVLRLLDELAALRPGKSNDQRSLAEQLGDLHELATKAGLYDAADWLRGHIEAFRGSDDVIAGVRAAGAYCTQVWGDADRPCPDHQSRGGHQCSLLKHAGNGHVCGCGSRW